VVVPAKRHASSLPNCSRRSSWQSGLRGGSIPTCGQSERRCTPLGGSGCGLRVAPGSWWRRKLTRWMPAA
jgi:hypothetical protein